jgi:hypothetical protein
MLFKLCINNYSYFVGNYENLRTLFIENSIEYLKKKRNHVNFLKSCDYLEKKFLFHLYFIDK